MGLKPTRVLVVSYSQTGQLDHVLSHLIAPFEGDSGVEIDRVQLQPHEAYPFPWPFFRFLEEFPEAVRLDPPPLRPVEVDTTINYDLIILGYTVWFLSPAPPITAFLGSEQGQELLRDRPVVTVTACRNMWAMAHQTVSSKLEALGARHCDHAAFVDAGSSLATLVTTPRWMLTGKKDSWLGLPAPGVSEAEVQERAPRLGRALARALHDGQLDGRAPVLTGVGAVQVDEGVVVSEWLGYRSFWIWSRWVRAAGPKGSLGRRVVLSVYLVFLLLMIVTVVPLSLLLRKLLRPLMSSRLKALREYHEQPSGSGQERVGEV